MLPKSEKLCLDILTAIDEIQNFLAEVSQASFTRSRLQQVAIEREMVIVGEALNGLFIYYPKAGNSDSARLADEFAFL